MYDPRLGCSKCTESHSGQWVAKLVGRKFGNRSRAGAKPRLRDDETPADLASDLPIATEETYACVSMLYIYTIYILYIYIMYIYIYINNIHIYILIIYIIIYIYIYIKYIQLHVYNYTYIYIYIHIIVCLAEWWFTSRVPPTMSVNMGDIMETLKPKTVARANNR